MKHLMRLIVIAILMFATSTAATAGWFGFGSSCNPPSSHTYKSGVFGVAAACGSEVYSDIKIYDVPKYAGQPHLTYLGASLNPADHGLTINNSIIQIYRVAAHLATYLSSAVNTGKWRGIYKETVSVEVKKIDGTYSTVTVDVTASTRNGDEKPLDKSVFLYNAMTGRLSGATKDIFFGLVEEKTNELGDDKCPGADKALITIALYYKGLPKALAARQLAESALKLREGINRKELIRIARFSPIVTDKNVESGGGTAIAGMTNWRLIPASYFGTGNEILSAPKNQSDSLMWSVDNIYYVWPAIAQVSTEKDYVKDADGDVVGTGKIEKKFKALPTRFETRKLEEKGEMGEVVEWHDAGVRLQRVVVYKTVAAKAKWNDISALVDDNDH